MHLFARGKGDLDGQHSARGQNTKMPKAGRWSAQLGTSRACEPWNESKQVSGTSHNAWEYTAHVNKGALELNTEYVSNRALI